jgi:adhesin transport system outer membrane protein
MPNSGQQAYSVTQALARSGTHFRTADSPLCNPPRTDSHTRSNTAVRWWLTTSALLCSAACAQAAPNPEPGLRLTSSLELTVPAPRPATLARSLEMPQSLPLTSAPTTPDPGMELKATVEAPVPGMRFPTLARLLELPQPLPLSATSTTATADLQPDAASKSDLVSIARKGVQYSLEVEAARQRLASFGYTQDAARGALLPHADLRVGDGRGRLTSVDPAVVLPRREVVATLRQALVDEPARHEWSRQRRLVESARQQLDSAVSGALLESSQAFLGAVQAAVSVRLGQEYEALLAELLRYIGERAAAGGTSKADLERVKARVANTRTALADADAALKVALRTLVRLTGEAPEALELASAGTSFVLPGDVAAATALAARSNHDLLAARIEAMAATDARDVQRAKFLPRLELELSHSRALNAAGTESVTRDTRLMLVMNIPLLNGGTDLAQSRAEAARFNELTAKASNVERKLIQEVRSAYDNLDAADLRFGSIRNELDANTRVVNAFRAQMVGASRSLLDVLDAYQRQHQSQLDLTQTLIAEAQNQLRVAHLTGALEQMLEPTLR